MFVETLFTISALDKYVDVNEWTNIIGLKPLAAVTKGEKSTSNPRSLISVDSWWTYGINKTDSESVESQLKEVLKELLLHHDAIQSIQKFGNIDLTIASFVWSIDDTLILDLSLDTIKDLNLLGCSYSITSY